MRSKNIILIIQARMDSSRLPKKVMAEILGKPLIWHMVQRLRKIPSVSEVVISTTTQKEDKQLIEFAESEGIKIVGGAVEDIIDRLYQTSKKFNPTVVVKVNADCPLVDPKLIEEGIQIFLKSSEKPDLVTNSLEDTYPEGMQFAIFDFHTLEKLWSTLEEPFWREYFFRYMIEYKENFKIIGMKHKDDLSSLRWTVDYKEDLDFVREIFHLLYEKNPFFTMEEILESIEKNPQLTEINKKYSSKIGVDDFNRLKEKNKKANLNQ